VYSPTGTTPGCGRRPWALMVTPNASLRGLAGYADPQKESTGVVGWCADMHAGRISSGS